MKDREKISSRKKSRAPENPRKRSKSEVFGDNLRKYNTDFDNFWSESAKQTLRAAEENRTSIPFQLPQIFEPEDGSGGTISCRPARKFTKKIFFCQTILNGPIREKKHVFRNSKIFCPYDLTLARHQKCYQVKINILKDRIIQFLNSLKTEKNLDNILKLGIILWLKLISSLVFTTGSRRDKPLVSQYLMYVSVQRWFGWTRKPTGTQYRNMKLVHNVGMVLLAPQL